MAITRADLLIFNNVESTDLVHSPALELPYSKPLAYIPNVTFSTRHEQLVRGQGGLGSQVVIRELHKGSVKKAKATDEGGLDYTHQHTADTIRVIPIDDVASKSEKVYEAVDKARQSKTGAAKAEIVYDSVLEATQEYFTGYLENSALESEDTVALTNENFLEILIAEQQKLDYRPDVLMVSKETYGIILGFLTTGEFRANPQETVVRTGVLGTILGLPVVVDYNLTKDFVLYNKEHFPAFTMLENFDVIAAADFNGSYVRGQTLSGGGGRVLTTADIGTGAGIWGISYKGV